MDQSLLRDYIAHARDSVQDGMSDLVTRLLINAYFKMRKIAGSVTCKFLNCNARCSNFNNKINEMYRLFHNGIFVQY